MINIFGINGLKSQFLVKEINNLILCFRLIFHFLKVVTEFLVRSSGKEKDPKNSSI